MAFSKAPSQSTYQSKDLKLIWTLSGREAGVVKDPILKNGFFEIIRDKTTKDEDYFVIKRDGVELYPSVSSSSNVRGIYYWEDEDKLFIAFDQYVSIFTGATGVEELTIAPFSTTTGDVSFTEFNYDTGNTHVVIGDGDRLWVIDNTNTPTECVSADLPKPYLPSLLFLDGYLFVVKKDTADIYNSNLNDPLLWTAGDFISAEMLPDTLLKISRLNNYMIALGSASIEYFFDAANASGSPMQRNDTPVKQIGFLGGLATYGNKTLLVGQYANTSPDIFILEDFKVDEVSSPTIRRLLTENSSYTAAVVTNGGHDFYVLSLDSLTFAMDLDTRIWYQWTFGNDGDFQITNASAISYDNKRVTLFHKRGGGNLYYFSPTKYQDVSTNIVLSGTTQKQYFDTTRRKFMSRLVAMGDQQAGSILQVSWSNDDYQTFSSPRSLDMSKERPQTTQLGSFFSRSFRYTHTSNTKLRLSGFEIEYNIGAM